MSRYGIWHGRVVWFGIILNMFFVFPLVLAPGWLLGLLNIPLDQLIWARASGMLLFIISVFYIPATWDLKRYRASAWFSIFPSRTFGATFFTVAVFVFGYPVGFLSIAIVDGFIGITTFILLLLVTLEEKRRGTPVTLK
ncbi:hypothetical protein [Nitrosococcus watsonii]|uniref:Putative transmembrane protein n=1 Tax=Nitrosococcus watsoni (strain C-113) TaxID=105559 RepID=D8K5R1_NITWC|nr:hypothetical protein [Nitrosococcus watsonii]ADJ28238.1 putative transmembrane protein [Nitrosococcus watsonii C-113]